jgi:glycosyltransferase involved in cell wall biosynthesis
MKPIHLVVPGPLDQRTGGYLYDRRIVDGLRAQGLAVTVHELAGRFPLVDDIARDAAAAATGAMAGGLPVIDGLALPAFADLAERLPDRWVVLIHHPLALETGLSTDQVEALAAVEHRLLPLAERIVVTSHHTVDDLAPYEVPQPRIGVVLPGTDPAPLARGSGGPGFALLCVASLTPRKGHLILLEALAELVDLDWRLTCVGSKRRDPGTAQAIAASVVRLRLDQRVALVDELDEAGLAPLYDRADLFVLASYHEGYGMALAEALAHGLPVVATNAGAIPGTVPPSAGLLVEPGDPAALAGALRQIMTDPALRDLLTAGAVSERARLPSWLDAARDFSAELDRAVR